MAVGVQKAWSVTASSNASADSNVSMAEGQTPASLNDGVRAAMAAIKGWANQIGAAKTSGGSANAQTLTSDSVAAISTAYAAGMIFCFKAGYTNSTTTPTFNVDGVGAKTIKKGGAQAALAASDIIAGGIYWVAYEASGDCFLLLNPESGLGNTQPLDATLTALAAGTTGADVLFYWSGTDTLSTTTLTTAGRALIDDAAASNQRTTLELGTAATQNTGTSGTNVPLLDGANTWSAQQTFIGNLLLGGSSSSYRGLTSVSGTYASAGAILVFGGSGDAHTYLSALTGSNVKIRANGLAGTDLDVGNASLTWGGNTVLTTANGLKIANNLSDLNNAGTARTNLGLGSISMQAASSVAITGGTIAGITSGQIAVAISAETSGTLTNASANKTVNASGGVTINDGVFTAGDRVEIYAGSSSRTITQDTGMTLRLDGTSTTGNRTIAAYGRMNLYFNTNAEAIVSGMGVT